MSTYRFFIAGIIQGSIAEGVHSQDYRNEIKEIIEAGIPGAKVYCPFENHPNSLGYDDQTASKVFFDHIEMAAGTGVLVTYLPEASMGTAVEMYAAHQAGRAVITISPMSANWAAKFLSDLMLPDLGAFRAFVESGGLLEFVDEYYSRKP